jgi:hypothetical protein
VVGAGDKFPRAPTCNIDVPFGRLRQPGVMGRVQHAIGVVAVLNIAVGGLSADLFRAYSRVAHCGARCCRRPTRPIQAVGSRARSRTPTGSSRAEKGLSGGRRAPLCAGGETPVVRSQSAVQLKTASGGQQNQLAEQDFHGAGITTRLCKRPEWRTVNPSANAYPGSNPGSATKV